MVVCRFEWNLWVSLTGLRFFCLRCPSCVGMTITTTGFLGVFDLYNKGEIKECMCHLF